MNALKTNKMLEQIKGTSNSYCSIWGVFIHNCNHWENEKRVEYYGFAGLRLRVNAATILTIGSKCSS